MSYSLPFMLAVHISLPAMSSRASQEKVLLKEKSLRVSLRKMYRLNNINSNTLKSIIIDHLLSTTRLCVATPVKLSFLEQHLS